MTPAIIIKNDDGQTYTPETVRTWIAVYVRGVLRWSCSMPLTNSKTGALEEALQYVPERFRHYVATAELKPRRRLTTADGILAQARFDCTKDGT